MFRWQNVMRFVNAKTLQAEHEKQSRRKATGIDSVTKDEYGANIEVQTPAGQKNIHSESEWKTSTAGDTSV